MGSADIVCAKSNLTELILIGGASSERDISRVLIDTPIDIICQLLKEEWLSDDPFRWVRKYCERHLVSLLNNDNCLKLLTLASQQKCYVLLSQCFRYGAKNFSKIWKTREFLSLTSAELSRLLDQPEVKYHGDLHTALYFWYRKDSKSRQMTYNVLTKRKYSSSKNLVQLNQEIERYTPKTTEKKKNYNEHPTGSLSCELLSDLDGHDSNDAQSNIIPAISCPSVSLKQQTNNPPQHMTHHVSLTTAAYVHAPKHFSTLPPEDVFSCPSLDTIDGRVSPAEREYCKDTLNNSLCTVPTRNRSEYRTTENYHQNECQKNLIGLQTNGINKNKPKSSSLPLLDLDEDGLINHSKEDSTKDINENIVVMAMKGSTHGSIIEPCDESFVATQQTPNKDELDLSPSNGDSAYESCPSLSDSNNELLSNSDLESIGSCVYYSSTPICTQDKLQQSGVSSQPTAPDFTENSTDYDKQTVYDSCPTLSTDESRSIYPTLELTQPSTEMYDSCPMIVAEQGSPINNTDSFPNSVRDSCPSLLESDTKTLQKSKDKPEHNQTLNGKISESCPSLDTTDKNKQESLNKKNTCTVEQILSQCNLKTGDSTKIVNGEKYILVLGKSTKNKPEQEVFMIDLNSQGKPVLFLAEIPTKSDACAACYFNFCMTDYLFVSECNPKKSNSKWYMYNMFESDWKPYQNTKSERIRQGMVTVENRVYSIGGEVNKQTSSSIDAHNLKTKRWKNQGNLAIPVSDAPCAVSGDKIFIFGGSSDREESVCVVQCFDINKKKLRIIAIVPCCCTGGRAIVVRGKIFIATVEGKLLKFDPKMCEFTVMADQPFCRSHFGMVSDGKSIFLLGGRLGKEKVSFVTVYDIGSNTWTYTMALDVTFTAKIATVVNYKPN